MLMLASLTCGELNVSSQFKSIQLFPLLISSDTAYLDPHVAGVEWNELSTFHEDYSIDNVSTLQTQNPPSNNSPDAPSANPSSS